MVHGESIYGEMALVCGSGNPRLAGDVCRALQRDPIHVEITQFSNENIFVQLQQSVRSKDVFIIQPTCSPVNYNVMELLILIDTVRRASAGRITAIIPFFSYARSDKKDKPRVPITARLIADMIQTAGADRVMTVDLHAGQIQGFFAVPTDELSAFPLLCSHFQKNPIEDLVVVAADLGFAKKARNFAAQLGAPVAFVEKRRDGADTYCLTVIGDVRDRNVLIVDDEVDRGGTISGAAKILRDAGAKDVSCCFVHATFSEDAIALLSAARFRDIVFTDTEPIPDSKRLPNMTVIGLGPWLAAVVNAVHQGRSVGQTLQSYDPNFSEDA